MAEVQWIKFYTNTFDISRKIKKIELMPQGDTILIIWVKLLTLAGKVNDGGAIYITQSIPYEIEDLAEELRRPIDVVEKALSILERFDMIEVDDGYIYISSWEEYQNTDKLAEIRAKDRERKRLKKAQAKALLSDGGDNSTEIPRNIHGISTEVPHIEEKDKEKEFHSFVPSAQNANDFFREKVVEGGFELGTEEADAYMDQLKADMKLRYQGGTLGQGILFMSDNQFDDLCERLSLDELHKYIDIVIECEKNGKQYKKKSHYQAILDMANKDRRIKN